MRITGGNWRGRPLGVPKSDATRPTSDRVREAIFNILAHHDAFPRLEGARIIDLFAGTGALGLEALSRGGRSAIFVDTGTEARAVLRANIEALGAQGRSRLFRRDATRLGPAQAPGEVDFAFLDPPYSRGLADAALASLVAGNWLAQGAVVVVEERKGEQLIPPAPLEVVESRIYGDTQVQFLTMAQDTADEACARSAIAQAGPASGRP